MLGWVGAGFVNCRGRIADRGRLVRGRGDERSALHRRATAETAFAGKIAGQAFEGEILAQRVIGIAVPHEDAAQIGMLVELDAHHVEDFALVPIGALINRYERINGRIIFADFDPDAKMGLIVCAAERAEFIKDFIAWFIAEMIDTGDVDEEVEVEILFQMCGSSADDVAVDLDAVVTAKFLRLSDLAGELFLERGDGVWGGHGFYEIKAGGFLINRVPLRAIQSIPWSSIWSGAFMFAF